MNGRKKYSIFMILIIGVFFISCLMDSNLGIYQDSLDEKNLLTGERCIDNPDSVNIGLINNFLKDVELGKSEKLVKYLASNIEWIVAGNPEKIPFAGTFHRIKEVKNYLKIFYQSINISDLIITKLIETQPDIVEAYIRLQGAIPATRKTIDVEFLYTWQFNSKHKIEKITVSYAIVSLELAYIAGENGHIVSDVFASAEAINMTNSLLPVKELLCTAPLEQLRHGMPGPYPADVIFETKYMNGINVDFVKLNNTPVDNKVMLYLPGGGFMNPQLDAHRALIYSLLNKINLPFFVVNYKLSPENPFPAGLNDCFTVYNELLETYDPQDIVFMGDSAGGNLVFSLMLMAKGNNVSLPALGIALSPWLDLTNSGDTMVTNIDADTFLPPIYLEHCTQWYLGSTGISPQLALVSPIFGNINDFPPIYLTAGSTEILLSDSVRMFNLLTDNGNDATIEIASGLAHVWPAMCAGTQDAEKTLTRVSNFIKDKLNLE